MTIQSSDGRDWTMVQWPSIQVCEIPGVDRFKGKGHKKSKGAQLCWPTTPNIVGCYMMCPFAYPVACCCVFLGVGAQSLKPVKRLALCNQTQHCWELLSPFACSLILTGLALMNSLSIILRNYELGCIAIPMDNGAKPIFDRHTDLSAGFRESSVSVFSSVFWWWCSRIFILRVVSIYARAW